MSMEVRYNTTQREFIDNLTKKFKTGRTQHDERALRRSVRRGSIVQDVQDCGGNTL